MIIGSIEVVIAALIGIPSTRQFALMFGSMLLIGFVVNGIIVDTSRCGCFGTFLDMQRGVRIAVTSIVILLHGIVLRSTAEEGHLNA